MHHHLNVNNKTHSTHQHPKGEKKSGNMTRILAQQVDMITPELVLEICSLPATSAANTPEKWRKACTKKKKIQNPT